MRLHRGFVPFALAFATTIAGCSASTDADPAEAQTSDVTSSAIKHVFLIVMENHDWADIQGNPSAPYINGTLLPSASYALDYRSAIHPSEPNYIWLEAGDNLGVTTDDGPDRNHQSTTEHLVSQLVRAGKTWKSYQEDIEGDECPLSGTLFFSRYAPRHNPMVYFDDVTNGGSKDSANCIEHVRPYGELAQDLAGNQVPDYVFITPNLCDDMHGGAWSCLFSDLVRRGDDWLSKAIPMITSSAAYRDGGAIFITWDESEHGDAPIGMIVLSPLAKGHGYASTVPYTHSSTVRTLQEIFHLSPFLRNAATSNDLSDLFVSFP